MTRLIRFPRWLLPAFNPRKPLTGLALKLMAVGMVNINRSALGTAADLGEVVS